MLLVCHLALRNHVIKQLNEFMIKNPSRYVTILPGLVAMDPVIVEI